MLHAPMKAGKDWQKTRYSALLRVTAAPEERTDDDRALRKGASSRVRGAAAFAILRQLLPLLKVAASLGAAPLACPFAPLAQLFERFGKALPGRLPVASGEPEQRQHDRHEEADEDPHRACAVLFRTLRGTAFACFATLHVRDPSTFWNLPRALARLRVVVKPALGAPISDK